MINLKKIITLSLIYGAVFTLEIYANNDGKHEIPTSMRSGNERNKFDSIYRLSPGDSIDLKINMPEINGVFNWYHGRERSAFYFSVKCDNLQKNHGDKGIFELKLHSMTNKDNYHIVFSPESRQKVAITGKLPPFFKGGVKERANGFYFYGNFFDKTPSDYSLEICFLALKKSDSSPCFSYKKNVRICHLNGDSRNVMSNNLKRWKTFETRGNYILERNQNGVNPNAKFMKPDKIIVDPWCYPPMASEILHVAAIAGNVKSKYYGKPEMIRYAIDGIDYFISEASPEGLWWVPKRRQWVRDDPNVNRFILYPLSLAILELQKFPAGKKAFLRWKDIIKKSMDYQYKAYLYGLAFHETGKLSDTKPVADKAPLWGGRYLNQDVMVLISEATAAKLFNNPIRQVHAHNIMKVIRQQLFQDGGFRYIHDFDESPGYHSINIQLIAAYYTLTKDPLAEETLRATSNYLVYTLTAEGRPECWSDVWWKQLWQSCRIPTLVIASYFVSERKEELNSLLYSLLQRQTWIPRVPFAVPYVRPITSGHPMPEKYLVYDTNINGIRGRDRCWYYGVGLGHAMKNNFSGGQISTPDYIDSSDGEMAGARFVIKQAGSKNSIFLANTNWHDTRSALTKIGTDGAVMAVDFIPQMYNGTVNMTTRDTGWRVTQLLVAESSGLYGLLTLRATHDITGVYSIQSELAFSRGYIRNTGGDSFSLKKMMIKIFSKPAKIIYGDTGMQQQLPSLLMPVSLNRNIRTGEQFRFSYYAGPQTPPDDITGKGAEMKISKSNNSGMIIVANLSDHKLEKSIDIPEGGKSVKIFCGTKGSLLSFRRNTTTIIFELPSKSVAAIVYN